MGVLQHRGKRIDLDSYMASRRGHQPLVSEASRLHVVLGAANNTSGSGA
jgi:hypothetical protein